MHRFAKPQAYASWPQGSITFVRLSGRSKHGEVAQRKSTQFLIERSLV